MIGRKHQKVPRVTIKILDPPEFLEEQHQLLLKIDESRQRLTTNIAQMRQKRAKTYRKLLTSYIRHFGLRPPLQILVDAPMALTLAGMKLSSAEVPARLASVLQVSNALPAGVKELYRVQKEGEREKMAVELAKQWERRYCNHKEAIPGERCVCEVIGERNKHRYVLAAGSAELRAKIRHEVAGVPVVHANDRNVLVMEPMSELTRQRCDEMERKKLNLSGGESLGKRKADDGQEVIEGDKGKAELTATLPRKKKAKGPNPLSMRKPKRAREIVSGPLAPKKRRTGAPSSS